MPDTPGTGPQGPTPELRQPDVPVSILTQVTQDWEQMKAKRTQEILMDSPDYLKRTHQIRLQILDLLVQDGLANFFKPQA